MLNGDLKNIVDQGERLFSKRGPFMALCQELAENFAPEIADFTASRSQGADYASNLMTSYPIIARRELEEGLGSIMRPSNKDWFAMGTQYETKDHEGRAWLEWATGVQKRAMYDKRAQFKRATKEADKFYVTTGQAVISGEMSRDLDALLFRSWHLRDVAWCDNAEGVIDQAHLKWKPTAQQLNSMFGGNIAPNLKTKLTQDPYCEVNCRNIVIPTEMYRGEKKWRTKFISLMVDLDNMYCMEEVGQRVFKYVIPRWATISGSQYAHSPAAMTALPDARLLQAMTLTLLEAGEKAVNPPMVANKEIFRGDFPMFAGGLTWADMAYDGKISDHFQLLTQDKSGIPFGLDLRNDIREMVTQAFYLNKLNLPPYDGTQMTAYEVSQRVQEYIRQALPLFEPTEDQYNGGLCELTFDLLLNHGGFGPPDNIPRSLRNRDVTFTFESPLKEAIERQKSGILAESLAVIGQAAALDPNAPLILDATIACRDVVQGLKAPMPWLRSVEQVQEIVRQREEEQMAAQTMAAMEQGANAAKLAGEANKAFAEVA